jgi:hypothetical protein
MRRGIHHIFEALGDRLPDFFTSQAGVEPHNLPMSDPEAVRAYP